MLKNEELNNIVGGARYAKNIIIDFIFKQIKRSLMPIRVFRKGVR